MANGDIIPRSFWRFPMLPVSSWLEDIEELLPTANLINGLSVSEDEKNIYVEAAVPGIDPKDIDVTFDKGVLTIRAQKTDEEKGKKYQRKATSTFLYRVQLPEIEQKAEPAAAHKNGVTTVTFAKRSEAKPKKIVVKAD